MNYNEANGILQGRNQESKKLDNNTYLIRINDYIAVKLHDTNIIEFHADKTVLTSGGWQTKTTKDRLNTYSGFRISQESGKWSLITDNSRYPFKDGITILNNGKVLNAGKDTLKKDKALKTKIKAYANLCASHLPLEKPNSGDCFYCHMSTTEGKSLGDAINDTDHLTLHMQEKYVVSSLVFNAMVEAGYNPQRNIQFSLVFNDASNMIELAQDCVKRSVYKYMVKRFGFAC